MQHSAIRVRIMGSDGVGENVGLLLVTDILEKYGIVSVTDVSDLTEHDFIQLETPGLKLFQLNHVKRWCETSCVTEVLPSSSSVSPPTLTSSVTLSVGNVHNEEDDT